MKESILGLVPYVDMKTRVLVLGSMPGEESLRQGLYYAHPRNRFWPLMETVFGIPAGLTFEERIVRLNDAGIGLWDVLASCSREGSLDANIVTSTECYNDFYNLFNSFPGIVSICCNGLKAYKAFSMHVLLRLDSRLSRKLAVISMPSTSPANARYGLADLVLIWSDHLLGENMQ